VTLRRPSRAAVARTSQLAGLHEVPATLRLYAVVVVGAELVRVAIGVVPALLIHAVLLFVLLIQFALASDQPYRRALPILALVPLVRVVAHSMPLQGLPVWSWYALTGAPVLVAALLLLPLLDIRLRDIGLQRGLLRLHDLPIVAASAPVSLLIYVVIRPPAIGSFAALPLAVLSVVIFSAFMEEIVFRALPRASLEVAAPATRRVFTSIVWAAMYLAAGSWIPVLTIAVVGYLYAWSLDESGSLFPAIVAHGLLKVGALLVWPLLLG
jgi:hypothetical protein